MFFYSSTRFPVHLLGRGVEKVRAWGCYLKPGARAAGAGYLGNARLRALGEAARSIKEPAPGVCQIAFDLLQIKEFKILKQSKTPEDGAKVMGLQH